MTQEELEGNKLIAEYLHFSIKENEFYTIFPYEWMSTKANCRYNFNIQDEDGLDLWDFIEFHNSMDWLYPVYQKITKYSDSIEVDKLDSYTKMQIRTKYLTIRGLVAAAFDIDHIFKEIVAWIKIYNLKVLKNESTNKYKLSK